MPNIHNLRPTIKITEKQFKQLLNRILTERGGLKASSREAPIIGENVSTSERMIPQKPQMQMFDTPQRELIPSREQYDKMFNVIPSRMGEQQALPGIPQNTPQQMYANRVGNPVGPTMKYTAVGAEPDAAFPTIKSQGVDTYRVQSRSPVYGKSALEELQESVEPTEKAMGRLYEEREGVHFPRDYSWAEARIRALQDSTLIPENDSRVLSRIPPTTRIRKVLRTSPENMLPEEYAEGLAYERLHWKPIETETEKVARSTIQLAAKEAGVNISAEQASDIATVFSDLWSKLGGGRSSEGKMWDMYRKSTRDPGARKATYDAKSYFLRSASEWKRDPERFKSRFPREANKLEVAWKNYMEGVYENPAVSHYEGHNRIKR